MQPWERLYYETKREPLSRGGHWYYSLFCVMQGEKVLLSGRYIQYGTKEQATDEAKKAFVQYKLLYHISMENKKTE